MLAAEFMRRFARKHGVHIKGFTDGAAQTLLDHNWPGNIRELQNVVERAVILCGDSGMLENEHLGLASTSTSSTASATSGSNSGGISSASSDSSGEFSTLAEIEKQQILAALDRCHGNRTHAAKILNVSIRTLRNKLHEYNGTSPKSEDEPESVGS